MIRKQTMDAFRDLLEDIEWDGPINPRSQTILIAALRCTPVREALLESLGHFQEYYEDAKKLVRRAYGMNCE